MIFLLYPHQLFHEISVLQGKKVLLIEEPFFFTQYAFHIQKLVMHRASMKFYEEYLLRHNIEVEYFEDESYLSKYAHCEIEMYDVVDDYLFQKISKHLLHVSILPNPNFLNTQEGTKFLHTFYINRRKELHLLIDKEGKPEGGVWSLDTQNRQKIPKDCKIPANLTFENHYIDEAKEYCKKFKSVGECKDFYYPTTFMEAKIVFEYFLEQKFADFGSYQDAIVKEGDFLFHSNISSALNSGLLDLHYVIQRVVDEPDVPLNSKEGFLRQIIGWREFMLRVYKDDGVRLRNSNFFDFKYKMPQKILEAKTGLDILDDTLKRVKKTAYAHHIERLMVLGNLFVLLEIHPDAVHEYFMANFIDAYDWVMVGNVYAMSGFSDGGSFTTKPYIASSNYLLKMSDYKRGSWCEVVDALYWSFMDKYSYKFETNPRMAMQIALLKKMPQEKLQNHKKIAKEFKTLLGMYSMKEEEINRLIEMAWQDRMPFDIIQTQYGISENQLKKMMRSFVSKKSYKRWRERVQGRKTKHTKKLDHKPNRFQGPW